MSGNGPSNLPPVRRGGWEARAGGGVRSRDWKTSSLSPLPCRDVGRRTCAAGNGSVASSILEALSFLVSSTRCYPMRPQSPLSCSRRSSWQLIQVSIGWNQACVCLPQIKSVNTKWTEIFHKQHMRTNHFKCRSHCINRLFLLIVSGL